MPEPGRKFPAFNGKLYTVLGPPMKIKFNGRTLLYCVREVRTKADKLTLKQCWVIGFISPDASIEPESVIEREKIQSHYLQGEIEELLKRFGPYFVYA